MAVLILTSPTGGTPQAATPYFSPPAGSYLTPQSVQILDATLNSTIYYTIDGSTPSTGVSTSFQVPTVSAIAPTFVIGNVTPNAVWMQTSQNNPQTGNGAYNINPWNAGALTGFIPNNPSTAQLGYAPGGQTTTGQREGTTCGAFLQSTDQPTFTTGQNMGIWPQEDYSPQIPMFTDPSVVMTHSMSIQIPTATGNGNQAYVNVDNRFQGPNGVWVSFNITVFRNGVSSIGVTTSYVSNVNTYLILVPLGVTGSSTYLNTVSGSFTGTPYTGYRPLSWTISYAQFAAALNLLNTAYPGVLTSLNPQDYTLQRIHLNAEIAVAPPTLIDLGWSMNNWTVQRSSAAGTSQIYTIPLTVSVNETIKAIATAPGYTQSAVATGVFNIQGQAAAPTFNPNGGSVAAGTPVTIQSATNGSTIYYTTNGSTPNHSSPSIANGGQVIVLVAETIKAIASAPSNTDSIVSSATFTISAASGLPNLPITYYTAIGGPQATNFSSTVWRQAAAKNNMIEFTSYPGIESGMGGQTISSSMADVKSRAIGLNNPYCLTGIYQIPQSILTSGDPRTGLFSALGANNWFVYGGTGPFPTGSPQPSGIGYATNQTATLSGSTTTPITPLGSSGWTNGLDFCQAAATYEYNILVNGTGSAVSQSNGNAVNRNVDFMYHDNQFQDTRNGGQWLCTSVTYGQGEFGSDSRVSPYLQAGYKRILDKWRALYPTNAAGKKVLQFGNCDQASFSSPLYQPAIQQLYDGPFSELMTGNPNAVATYASVNTMLARMQAYENNLRSGDSRAICIFGNSGGPCVGTTWPASQSSWTGTFSGSQATPTNNGGSATQTGNYWQGARYSLGIALLRGWAHELSTTDYTTLPFWLDEYNKSGAQWNWIGPPIPLLTTNIAKGSQGMYRVLFQFGTLFVNPLGNGNQTVDASLLPGGQCHALPNGGFSDPAINNGALLTSFVMKDADMRIVLP